MKRLINKDKLKIMKGFGWSSESEELFKKYNKDLFIDNAGTFTIMKVSDIWYWYFKLSSHKSNRLKYLCKCEIDIQNYDGTSFDYASELLKKKIKSSFQNIKVNDTPIVKYIDEYIEHLCKIGGWKKENRTRGSIQYDAWVRTEDNNLIKNSTSIRNKLFFISEFRKFCDINKTKVGIVPHREMKGHIKDFVVFLKNRNRRKIDGSISDDGVNLVRGTIKSFIQNCRYFLDWLVKPVEEDGRELFKEHLITLEYQTHLIKSIVGEVNSKLDYIDFKQSNYDTCVKETATLIRDVWIEYCINEGDLEPIREQRLSYTHKTKDGGILGTIQKNQPKNSIIMSDIVYFIGLLQLRYGFRISEILHSYRDKESWESNKHNNTQSSYFRNVSDGDEYYYVLEIRNSKLKNRSVPIEETIWSWHKPPFGIKCVTKTNTKGEIHYETNIIDVIFALFPKSALTFPSPNFYTKKDKGYSTTYYLNLFKEKIVNDVSDGGLGWNTYGINSSHHLRAFFISYMLRKKGVLPLDVCEITGHNLNTMMRYYTRVSEESKRNTLQKSKLRDILKS